MTYFIIDYIYQYLAYSVLGHPLLVGLLVLSVSVLLLIGLNLPRWAIMSYTSPVVLALSAPGYQPILIPEWVFYIVLIFLGIMWANAIMKIKGG